MAAVSSTSCEMMGMEITAPEPAQLSPRQSPATLHIPIHNGGCRQRPANLQLSFPNQRQSPKRGVFSCLGKKAAISSLCL